MLFYFEVAKHGEERSDLSEFETSVSKPLDDFYRQRIRQALQEKNGFSNRVKRRLSLVPHIHQPNAYQHTMSVPWNALVFLKSSQRISSLTF
jgi:hypothetical protein